MTTTNTHKAGLTPTVATPAVDAQFSEQESETSRDEEHEEALSRWLDDGGALAPEEIER